MQSDVALPPDITEETLASLVAHVLKHEDVSGEWELGVHFVDDAMMQSAHDEFMGINEPTDIMTFPYGEVNEVVGPDVPGGWSDAVMGGDLMISVDTAAANAAAADWSTSDELLFLIVHGVLHLVGWDDASVEERQAMLDRQAELMNGWRARP